MINSEEHESVERLQALLFGAWTMCAEIEQGRDKEREGRHLAEARIERLEVGLERIVVELGSPPCAPANSDFAFEIALTALGRGCNACWGQQCDECPFDEEGYQRTVARL